MKYLKQFFIIIVISFISEILHALLPLPVPAGIYGIVILFLLLETGLLKLSGIRETGRFLVEIMPVMFIPAAVGVLGVWDFIAPRWPRYLLVILVSTVLVMGVSGLVTQFVIRRRAGKEKSHD